MPISPRPVPVRPGRRRRGTVVGDAQLDPVAAGRRRPPRPWSRPACLRVLVSASCTMRYADRSTPGGSARGSPVTETETGQPGVADPVHQQLEMGRGSAAARARRRPPRPAGCRAADAARPAPPGRSSRSPPAPDGRPRGRSTAPVGGLRLEHDHGHAVGHEVVQLAGDPGPLVGDGGAGRLVAVVLERPGVRAEPGQLRRRCRIQRPSPQVAPRMNQPGTTSSTGSPALQPRECPPRAPGQPARTGRGRTPGGAVGSQRVDASSRENQAWPRAPPSTWSADDGAEHDEQDRQRPSAGQQQGQGEQRCEHGVQRPPACVVRRRRGPDLHLGGHEEPHDRESQRRPGHPRPRHRSPM